MLEIEIIHTPEELENTAKISVKYELWGTENMPETYAKMGYILHDGFYVKMVCMEKNPLRKYKNHNDPVWQDSAMEIFMQIPELSKEYMNFELNANAAILTAHGYNRSERTVFEDEFIESMRSRSEITEEGWTVWYRIPEKMLARVYGTINLKKGSTFRINFYKVCEGCTPGEFGSYTYIPLKEPSFHEPEYFAEAILV